MTKYPREIKIALCDDKKEFLDHIYALVELFFREKEVRACIDTFQSGEALIGREEIYDIAFLDVEMGGMDGLETAQELLKRSKHCIIFFITNYDDYLDDALEKKIAIHRFLTKPVKKERLFSGMESALNKLNHIKKSIVVHAGEGKHILKVDYADIIYASSEKRKSLLVTRDGRYVVEEKMKELGAMLDRTVFCETYKGIFVNVNYVWKYTRENVFLRCGEQAYTLYVSRRKYDDLQKAVFHNLK